MCSETTKHLWYKYYGLIARTYNLLSSEVICLIKLTVTLGTQVLRHVSIYNIYTKNALSFRCTLVI